MHLAFVILHIVVLDLLEKLLHARLAEELDERLIFRISLICSEKKKSAVLLISVSDKFLRIIEQLVHKCLLSAVESLYKRLVLHELLVLALWNRSRDDERSTGVIDKD